MHCVYSCEVLFAKFFKVQKFCLSTCLDNQHSELTKLNSLYLHSGLAFNLVWMNVWYKELNSYKSIFFVLVHWIQLMVDVWVEIMLLLMSVTYRILYTAGRYSFNIYTLEWYCYNVIRLYFQNNILIYIFTPSYGWENTSIQLILNLTLWGLVIQFFASLNCIIVSDNSLSPVFMKLLPDSKLSNDQLAIWKQGWF